MHIIAGLGLGLILLYFWLIGHWFARVVCFLGGGAFLGLIIVMWNGPISTHPNPYAYPIGFAVAWFVSGIPLYVHRYRGRHPSLALAVR